MRYKDTVNQTITSGLKEIGATLTEEQVDHLLETPKDSKMGDWAFPCFPLAKQLKKAPPKIAAELFEIVDPLVTEHSELAKVEATGPYLNFFINKSALASSLIPKILDRSYLAPRTHQADRVMIEYSQPNTHKAFHVGHVRNAALGDSVCRLFSWQGHEVVPVNYLGDEGTHVAKCLWYLTEFFEGTPPTKHRGEFLGELYVKATDLLDLSLLTRCPFPGVVAVKCLNTEPHPKEPLWTVARIETLDGEKTVVTAAGGFQGGDMVAWARPGTRVTGRAVGFVERKGVKSEGMLCAPGEIGLGESLDIVVVLPAETELGTELAEIFPVPEALPPGENSPLQVIQTRQAAVGKVLQRMESLDPEMSALWQETKDWSMQELYDNYRWLDCSFERYFFESEFGESGKEMVRRFQKKGVFIEDDGAVGADLSSYDLGFCVLLKRDGTALYATRDLTLAEKKFEEFGVNRSIHVVDSGQTLYFQQIFKCLELMGFEQAEKCYHLGYAQVVRPDGKMSSRKGNVILFSELQDRLLKKITVEFLEKYRGEWSDDEISDAAYKIALATIRYGMLKQDNNSQIVFDLDEWTSRSGNTGPYMMYAYARTRSILREVEERSNKSITEIRTTGWTQLKHETETAVLLHLGSYHNTLTHAYEQYAPSIICTYLYDLAKKFNRMYRECSVVKAENEELMCTRAALVNATGLLIQHGLSLLGVKTVERM